MSMPDTSAVNGPRYSYSGYSALLKSPQKMQPAEGDSEAVTYTLADPSWSTIRDNVFNNDLSFSGIKKYDLGYDRQTIIEMGALNNILFGSDWWDAGFSVNSQTDLHSHDNAVDNPNDQHKVKESNLDAGVYGNLRLHWGMGRIYGQLLANLYYRHFAGSESGQLLTLDFNGLSLNYDNIHLGDFDADAAVTGQALFNLLDTQNGVKYLRKNGFGDLLQQTLSGLYFNPHIRFRWYDSSSDDDNNYSAGVKLNVTPGINEYSNAYSSKKLIYLNATLKNGFSAELQTNYEHGHYLLNGYFGYAKKLFNTVYMAFNFGVLDALDQLHRSIFANMGGGGKVTVANTPLDVNVQFGVDILNMGKKPKIADPIPPWEDPRLVTNIQRPNQATGTYQPMDDLVFMPPNIQTEYGNTFTVHIGAKNADRKPGIEFTYTDGTPYGETVDLMISQITVYDGAVELKGVGANLLNKPLGDIRDNPLDLLLPCSPGGEDKYKIIIKLKAPAANYPDDMSLIPSTTIDLSFEVGADSDNPGITMKAAGNTNYKPAQKKVK